MPEGLGSYPGRFPQDRDSLGGLKAGEPALRRVCDVELLTITRALRVEMSDLFPPEVRRAVRRGGG